MPTTTSPKKQSLMPASRLRKALRAAGHHLSPVVQIQWAVMCIFGKRQDIQPPSHDPVGFGEEPVSPDIDPVPVMVHGARDPTDLRLCLDHRDVGGATLLKLPGCGEPCRSGPNDDNFSVHGIDSAGAENRMAFRTV